MEDLIGWQWVECSRTTLLTYLGEPVITFMPIVWTALILCQWLKQVYGAQTALP